MKIMIEYVALLCWQQLITFSCSMWNGSCLDMPWPWHTVSVKYRDRAGQNSMLFSVKNSYLVCGVVPLCTLEPQKLLESDPSDQRPTRVLYQWLVECQSMIRLVSRFVVQAHWYLYLKHIKSADGLHILRKKNEEEKNSEENIYTSTKTVFCAGAVVPYLGNSDVMWRPVSSS